MRAKGGSEAVQILSFRKRAAPGSVRCGGRAYDAGVRSEATGEAGNGWFGIDDQGGTATLSITRAIEVAPALRAPPDCLELAGRWTGASGALRGQSGDFSFVAPPGKTDAVTRFR